MQFLKKLQYYYLTTTDKKLFLLKLFSLKKWKKKTEKKYLFPIQAKK